MYTDYRVVPGYGRYIGNRWVLMYAIKGKYSVTGKWRIITRIGGRDNAINAVKALRGEV